MSHLADVRKQVDRLVDERLKDTDFFRVDTTVKGTARSPIISVYLDGDHGINVDDCATISRDLHYGIEDAEFCPFGFELNVSSPGLERSLRLPRQYARHVGRDVQVEVVEAGAGSMIEGRLLGADSGQVRIEHDAKEIVLPLGSIRRAVVKAAW